MTDAYKTQLRAYHEAGHAVTAYLVGILILDVIIDPCGRTATKDICELGARIQKEEPLALRFARAKIVFYLAGELAQFRQFKERDPLGASDDQTRINELLYSLYAYPDTDLYLRDRAEYERQYAKWQDQHETLKTALIADAEELVSFGWVAIDSIAQKLIDVKKLQGAEIKLIVLGTLPQKSEWPNLNWLDISESGELFYQGELIQAAG